MMNDSEWGFVGMFATQISEKNWNDLQENLQENWKFVTHRLIHGYIDRGVAIWSMANTHW